jgi:hypothetical protein
MPCACARIPTSFTSTMMCNPDRDVAAGVSLLLLSADVAIPPLHSGSYEKQAFSACFSWCEQLVNNC